MVMQERKVAFMGLEAHSTQACLSMLGIMAGMSSVNWTHSDVDDADVILTNLDHRQQVPSNKLCVVVYSSHETKPDCDYSLAHPFRVMPLISLFEEVCRALNKPAPSRRQTVNIDNDDVSLCQAVAAVMDRQRGVDGVWPLESSIGTFFIDPASHSFFADKPLLQRLNTQVRFRRLLPAIAAAPKGLRGNPIFQLSWYMTAPITQLLPWIDANACFHITRWPHSGSLPRSRERLSLSAHLSKRKLTHPQLLKIIHSNDTQLVNHFINSCSVSGLLKLQKAPSDAPEKTAASAPRFKGIINALRYRLGLST